MSRSTVYYSVNLLTCTLCTAGVNRTGLGPNGVVVWSWVYLLGGWNRVVGETMLGSEKIFNYYKEGTFDTEVATSVQKLQFLKMQDDTTKHLHVKHTTIKYKDANQWSIGYSSIKHWHGKKNSQINTHQHKQMYFVSPISEFSFLHFLTHLCSFVLHPVRITAAFLHVHKNVPHSSMSMLLFDDNLIHFMPTLPD